MAYNITIPSLQDFRHHEPVQLRFNDIDVLGHLNNTVYFSLFDTGKALYMKEVGLRKSGQSRPDTVIANINCTYLKPVVYDDSIFVLTRCSNIGSKSYTLQQLLVDADGDVRAMCETVMVRFDQTTGQTTEVTAEERRMIEEYENRTR